MPSDGREQKNEQQSLKNSTPLQRQALLAKQASPSVLAVSGDLRVCFVILDTEKQANHNVQRAQTAETIWAARAWRCRWGVVFE